jgi:hypothetical protein
MSKVKIDKVATNMEALTGRDKSKANLVKGGRRKGIPNKNTKALKDMILGALEKSGGEEYLVEQAQANPSAFMQLIGKVLPTELKNADAGGFVVHVTTGVPRD